MLSVFAAVAVGAGELLCDRDVVQLMSSTSLADSEMFFVVADMMKSVASVAGTSKQSLCSDAGRRPRFVFSTP